MRFQGQNESYYFIILTSQRTNYQYHIQITKEKGSECFTASKTPVGQVMTWFGNIHNITPHSKAIVPDCPYFCKVGCWIPIDMCFKVFHRHVCFSWNWVIKLIVSKNRIFIFLLEGSIQSFIIMLLSQSNLCHMSYYICFGVDKPEMLNVRKEIV